MARNLKRLTRADKIALSKLTPVLRKISEIKADISKLETLVAHGLASDNFLEDARRFKVTTAGIALLSSLAPDQQRED